VYQLDPKGASRYFLLYNGVSEDVSFLLDIILLRSHVYKKERAAMCA